MANAGSGHTHYLVSKEVVLARACIVEKRNEWNSLAFIKLGIGESEVDPATKIH